MDLGNGTGLAISPTLMAEIQAAADAENRTASDVVRDALERYLRETRPTARCRREVFKVEDLSDAELAAMTEGDMDPRHDHLNAEFE